jgi:hypothetical protein
VAEQEGISKKMKGKRRIVAKTYFNNNVLYHLQIYERNCFHEWITIATTTSKEAAQKWVMEAPAA